MKFTTGNHNENLQQLLAEYDFFLIDLDNTLYCETDYLFAGYQKIAARLANYYPVEEREITEYLESSFTRKGRNKLFNELCLEFDIPEKEIPAMLEILRSYTTETKFPLFKKMQWLVGELIKAGKTIFVVTNGNLQQQKNKTGVIEWGGFDAHFVFVYADEHKAKPDKAAFDYLVQHHSILPAKTVMIGDSTVDEEFAANAGIAFVHVSNFEPLNELP